jgi:hypothetical protein
MLLRKADSLLSANSDWSGARRRPALARSEAATRAGFHVRQPCVTADRAADRFGPAQRGIAERLVKLFTQLCGEIADPIERCGNLHHSIIRSGKMRSHA